MSVRFDPADASTCRLGGDVRLAERHV
jgi:hypothetical protein